MPTIDVLGHLRFSPSVRAEMRLGFDHHSATLATQQTTVIAPQGVAEEATIGYELATTRSFMSIAPMVAYDVVPRLSILGGMRVGFLLSSSFSQSESIVAPADIVYNDGSRTRFTFDSTAVPGASSTRLAAVFGARTSIPISDDEHWRIEPELIVNLGLSNLQSAQPWSMTSVRLGVGLAWQNYSEEEPLPPPPPAPPPPPPPTPKDTVIAEVKPPAPVIQPKQLKIRGIGSQMLDEMGQPLNSPKITVNNIVSLNLYALLNYVFFDDMSSEIPSRYKRLSPSEVKSYTLDHLNGAGTVAIYHDILNIVGYKLKNGPNEKIIITGCNANSGLEKGNRELSRQRAANVQEYFTRVWGIEPSRMTIQARDLPENPSNVTLVDGTAENRRVEITGQDSRLLDPIFFTDTLRTMNAASVALTPDVTTDTTLQDWTLNVMQGARKLDAITGKGALPATLNWNIAGRTEVFPRTQEPLDNDLSIVDVTGQKTHSQTRGYNVEQLYRKDKRLEKFNMIIFGYNESEFTKQHERILATIRPRINDKSKVTVEGYTDRAGNPEYNLKLSERRAKAVGSKLNLPSESSIGYGSAGELFDNDTPEGRLYSRTVIITIETPLE
jgi:outer membrane protein OmpA-like peptidoglycan-associated protein